MAKKTAPKKPSLVELAPISKTTSQITGSYVDKMLQPEDAVLLTRGGGDLKIYQELLRDDQVISTWQQRKHALVGKETIVKPASESGPDKRAADALRENISSLNWDKITEHMMYGILYGYGMGEVMWGQEDGLWTIDEIKVRKQRHFLFSKDYDEKEANGIVLAPDGNLMKGAAMPPRKFWTFTSGSETSDNPYGLGIGHQLYWPVFFKRNDIKFWLIFLEKFGMPTALGRLPGGYSEDPKRRAEVLQALRAIQVDSAVTIPESVEIELIEAARSGTADYATLHERMDKAISKVVVGQTMTTDDGSSMSQATVHKDVRDEIIEADDDLISGSFNRTVVRWWTDWNFPNAKPPKVSRDLEEPEDLNNKAERDAKIYAMGYKPTQAYIDETYGEGWEEKADEPAPFEPGGGGTIPAAFAEALGHIATQKITHRSDQNAIIEAARALAMDYEEVLGDQYDAILANLEESGDLLAFRERLNDLVAMPPSPKAVDKIGGATFISRMLGALRGQRE